MRVVFISKELNQTGGSGVLARMHLDSIKNAVGEENVCVMNLAVDLEPVRGKRYIAFGKYPSKLNRIKRHLEGNTYYFSNKIISDIVEYVIKNKIDVVFIDDSYFGRLAKELKNKCPEVRVLAFFHDVKAELFKIWMKRASNPINKWDLKIAMANERISVNCVDANILLNHAENELLKKYYNKEADYYLPVCVGKEDLKTDESPYDSTGKKHILFVGTSYLPNKNAARWFSKEVLPKVREQYDFWIVGKGLECLRDDISDPDVHIIGFVDSLAQYYVYSDVVTAPLVDGGGMKIKTAEAFSYGKVFMGSSESLHGYYDCLPETLKNNMVFCCDSKDDYIEALKKLSEGNIGKDKDALIKVYEEHYSPEAADNMTKQILFDGKK